MTCITEFGYEGNAEICTIIISSREQIIKPNRQKKCGPSHSDRNESRVKNSSQMQAFHMFWCAHASTHLIRTVWRVKQIQMSLCPPPHLLGLCMIRFPNRATFCFQDNKHLFCSYIQNVAFQIKSCNFLKDSSLNLQEANGKKGIRLNCSYWKTFIWLVNENV